VERRRLLQASLAALLPGRAVAMVTAQATLGRSAVISVRDAGARGDGSHDDTAAFQAAVDSLPASGGTVAVPAGRYLIDPRQSVRLRSHVHLRLDSGARLQAKPNTAERAYVVLVERASDVEISGGEIVGDRDAHLGTTGEWGHGVMIRASSRVTVRDIRISRCWGDGMSVGGVKLGNGESMPSTDILIQHVTCRGNRRQGLTIGGSRRVRVLDCEFSDTHGTKPEYGIDIEPDYPGRVEGVRIERCIVRGNRGGGIQVYRRVSDVSIRDCTIEGNGYGIYLQDTSVGLIAGNRIGGNAHVGVAVRGETSDYRIGENNFAGNSRRAMPPAKHPNAERGHIQVAKDARNIRISGNRYD
jgi:parallel beta-helix repeat protein